MHLTRKAKRDYWAGIMREWEASNETQADFCRLNNMELGNFSKWRQRLRKYNQTDISRSEETRFIEATISDDTKEPNKSAENYTLIFSNNVALHVPTSCTSAQLKVLFSILGVGT